MNLFFGAFVFYLELVAYPVALAKLVASIADDLFKGLWIVCWERTAELGLCWVSSCASWPSLFTKLILTLSIFSTYTSSCLISNTSLAFFVLLAFCAEKAGHGAQQHNPR